MFFIEHDLPKHQRVLNANIRTIVKTIGKEELQFEGSRIRVKERSHRRNQDRHNNEGQHQRSDYSRNTGGNQLSDTNTQRRDRYRNEQAIAPGYSSVQHEDKWNRNRGRDDRHSSHRRDFVENERRRNSNFMRRDSSGRGRHTDTGPPSRF